MYDVPTWVLPAHYEMCVRATGPTDEEVQRLPMADLLGIFRAREEVRGQQVLRFRIGVKDAILAHVNVGHNLVEELPTPPIVEGNYSEVVQADACENGERARVEACRTREASEEFSVAPPSTVRGLSKTELKRIRRKEKELEEAQARARALASTSLAAPGSGGLTNRL